VQSAQCNWLREAQVANRPRAEAPSANLRQTRRTRFLQRRQQMPRYADGFVIVVPKKNVKAYASIAKKAGKIWKEYGALEYCECVGDDLNMKFGTPFPKLCKPKRNEVVIFSWILYKSRAHLDKVNAKVMNDPRLKMDPERMPFDMKRMSYGGFSVMVDL
jgi:uncharacterized protein YbaA (DUF1428 family)